MAQRIAFLTWILFLSILLTSRAQDTPRTVDQTFQDAKLFATHGRHEEAATDFFSVYINDEVLSDSALGHLTEELIKAKLPNAASYFFIKTLQSENREEIRRILPYLPYMIDFVSGDLLRKYILRYTHASDYDMNARNHFFYFLAKDHLLKDEPALALESLSYVKPTADIMTQEAYLRGTAYAMLGQTNKAIAAFKFCQDLAKKSSDLQPRCIAGLARSYYQAQNFDRAEKTYDEIPKTSYVWTDILFEQAWNAYAKGNYNRALGRLVTYRSPDLDFVFNPEIGVLRAQSFLSLCLYDDVNQAIREFAHDYGNVGIEIKNLLLTNDVNLPAFYTLAKQVFQKKLHGQSMLFNAVNRFARGPYFARLLAQEKLIYEEKAHIHNLYRIFDNSSGLSEFLEKILNWRIKTIQLLGGLFVKNSLYDIYQDLLADLDKISYIKLELLNQTKRHLEYKNAMSKDESGVMKRGVDHVVRHDYQYLWAFNGEFWSDELGDYIFSLESECGS